MELTAIEAALNQAGHLPDHIYLTINASAEGVMAPEFADIIGKVDPHRLVIEVTEHGVVQDYEGLLAKLDGFRRQGVRLAVDDAGAGYSGLQHIVRLKPDIIKLDMSLTRNVDADPARRALASALIFYARETGCQILAEGIERDAELKTLKLLGVSKGQGYWLGRPVPIDVAASELSSAAA